jgi:hypothetical protein
MVSLCCQNYFPVEPLAPVVVVVVVVVVVIVSAGAVLSTAVFTAVVSVVVVSVFSAGLLLQAERTITEPATRAKNTFFICLVFVFD